MLHLFFFGLLIIHFRILFSSLYLIAKALLLADMYHRQCGIPLKYMRVIFTGSQRVCIVFFSLCLFFSFLFSFSFIPIYFLLLPLLLIEELNMYSCVYACFRLQTFIIDVQSERSQFLAKREMSLTLRYARDLRCFYLRCLFDPPPVSSFSLCYHCVLMCFFP